MISLLICHVGCLSGHGFDSTDQNEGSIRINRLSQKAFFNRGGAKAQRKLVFIMKYLRLLCDSATLRFFKELPFETTSF